MASNLLPIIKIAAPYIAEIAIQRIPNFTSKQENPDTQKIIDKQIEELQLATSSNSESIKILAENISNAVSAIEESASILEKRTNLYRLALTLASCLSIISISISLYLLF